MLLGASTGTSSNLVSTTLICLNNIIDPWTTQVWTVWVPLYADFFSLNAVNPSRLRGTHWQLQPAVDHTLFLHPQLQFSGLRVTITDRKYWFQPEVGWIPNAKYQMCKVIHGFSTVRWVLLPSMLFKGELCCTALHFVGGGHREDVITSWSASWTQVIRGS